MKQQDHGIKNYANFLYNLSPSELAIIASASGLFLGQGLTGEQQNALGNFLEAIGQILQCMGAQTQNLENKKEKIINK